jgi:hypothetical protein
MACASRVGIGGVVFLAVGQGVKVYSSCRDVVDDKLFVTVRTVTPPLSVLSMVRASHVVTFGGVTGVPLLA